MSLKNYSYSLLILTMFLLTQSAHAFLTEKKCGSYIFQIKIINGLDISERKFELYYKAPHQSEKIFFKTKKGVYLTAGCIQNKDKKNLMVFNEFYGGNMAPEDIYGVFDPNINKMLLRPANLPVGNSKEFKKLVGYSPPLLNEGDGVAFCCFRNQYKAEKNS